MARYRTSSLRPITSRKVMEQNSGNTVIGNQNLLTIAIGVQQGAVIALGNEVKPSEKIGTRGRIYVSWFVYNDVAPIAGSATCHINLLRQGQVNGADVPDPGGEATLATGIRQIVRVWKAIPGSLAAGSPMGFAGWIKLPNLFTKLHEGDTLILRLNVPQIGKFCAFTTYKVFT